MVPPGRGIVPWQQGLGQTSWRVTTAWQGQTRSRTQVDSFEIGGEQVPAAKQLAFELDMGHTTAAPPKADMNCRRPIARLSRRRARRTTVLDEQQSAQSA